MRLFMLVFCAVVALGAGPAQANPKQFWILGWQFNHWNNLSFGPYLEPAKQPQTRQWERDSWRYTDWVAQRPNALKLIDDFYKSGILQDQYVDNGVPVLEVGPGFYRLGGQGKRRVAETIDNVYQITQKNPNGLFMLYDGHTEEAIGAYTAYGLQIQ